MIEKFKKFVKEEIYNQLMYYDTSSFDWNNKHSGERFYLTAYEDDFEYVKRRVCNFIASWNAEIYVNMFPDRQYIVVEIWEN